MALIVALNRFVPHDLSMFSLHYRLFHRQKKIVFFRSLGSHPHFYWVFHSLIMALFLEPQIGPSFQ